MINPKDPASVAAHAAMLRAIAAAERKRKGAEFKGRLVSMHSMQMKFPLNPK